MSTYCRELNTDKEVECFVDGVLKIDDVKEKRDAINNIAAAERNMKDYKSFPTLTHMDNRDFEYRTDVIREDIRKQILNELINNKRLDNDDDIIFGKGGAAPAVDILSEHKVFYIIGPPASGKSGVANKIADAVGAYVLDSDFAKRKLPEYKNQISSASLLHEESDALIFNYERGNLLDHCIVNKYNIVIPKIGHNLESICSFCKGLKEIGYEVFLISVDLDRTKATQRAYYRFIETERYVPLSLIFDGYSNQPTLNYFKIKQSYRECFSGFGQISTDVARGKNPILLEEENLEVLKLIFGGVNSETKIKEFR